ncbi:MAG: flagellar basal body protein [Dehalococcoidia bacterium]
MPGVDINFIRQALDGLTRRQEAIANNIANQETAGYKRVTVNFEALLREQLAAQNSAARRLMAPLGQRSEGVGSGHIALKPSLGDGGTAAGFFGRQLAGLGSREFITAPRNDGNSVDVDQEMTQLATTQLQFAALSQALSTRLRTLRSVIENG